MYTCISLRSGDRGQYGTFRFSNVRSVYSAVEENAKNKLVGELVKNSDNGRISSSMPIRSFPYQLINSCDEPAVDQSSRILKCAVWIK